MAGWQSHEDRQYFGDRFECQPIVLSFEWLPTGWTYCKPCQQVIPLDFGQEAADRCSVCIGEREL